jgi:biopolymer transport protein ExbB
MNSGRRRGGIGYTYDGRVDTNRGFQERFMFSDGLTFLLKGGPIMWPLFACAIISVAVMIERAIALRRAVAGGEAFVEQVHNLLRDRRDEEAQRLAEAHGTPAARLMAYAIKNRNRDYQAIERSLEEMALRETPVISQRLGILDTIITIAPLLGLLGTVTGMIKAFNVVGDPNSLNGPAAITGGVAEALIATATGLAIAIVTLVGYNALGERVKAVVSSMEIGATEVINVYADRQVGEQAYEAAATRA